jgi:UDP-galactopyranose mutase
MAISISEYRIVVVGAGFFGATVAREIADRYGLEVLVVDKRDHFGGNSYSKIDEGSGIEYHAYGSHIFHTSNDDVWRFVSQFTEFNNYRHRVLTRHNERVYSMPINLMTINSFFNSNYTPAEAAAFLSNEIARERVGHPTNLEEKAISLIGRQLYEAFIRGYTQKQWNIDPKLLPAETINRLPVRLNYNEFYFSDRFEGIPLEGYARLFQRMLDRPKITIMTRCDYFAIANEISPNAVIVYTGPVDAYFGHCLGRLGWRTLDLELERLPLSDFQGTAVMNYADLDVGFTRIHEFKHYHPERRYSNECTLIMREYSRLASPRDEPYYPINTMQDKALYDRYKVLAKQELRTVFGGRLGTYRYLDMHQAIGAALRAIDVEIVPLLRQLSDFLP